MIGELGKMGNFFHTVNKTCKEEREWPVEPGHSQSLHLMVSVIRELLTEAS